ncbi:hypothetical protein J4Q44_G00376450 [Coregonus suidteri]|uniref:E3 ubiquitin/ISG15 ligase TRIM25-like n=1 Tax=Coregonus suidteri TaxID=861788 RepID=A0AAN8Q5C7_9TELE
MASSLNESQFQCSICLELFTDPVSTPCGHNFCKNCIGEYWDISDQCQCPLCKETFGRRPELRINTSFREVVDHFKKMTVNEGCIAATGEVACDVCSGRKIKALKSCLVCLTSYCETHLEPHQRVVNLKRHKLIDPVENLEDRMCKKHDRLLELFCRSDQTCVCQFCAETDHKHHHTVPLQTELQLKMIQIQRSKAVVQQMIQDRQRKVEEINASVALSRGNAEREIVDSVDVFTALIQSIESSQAELIEVIEEKKKATESRAERLIKELEQEITELQRKSTELEQLSHTEDHLHLVQSFYKQTTLPKTKSWTNVAVSQVNFLGCVRNTVCQVKNSVEDHVRKLSATDHPVVLSAGFAPELKKMQKYAVDVTMDPNTAGPWLILSEDGKQAQLTEAQAGVKEKLKATRKEAEKFNSSFQHCKDAAESEIRCVNVFHLALVSKVGLICDRYNTETHRMVDEMQSTAFRRSRALEDDRTALTSRDGIRGRCSINIPPDLLGNLLKTLMKDMAKMDYLSTNCNAVPGLYSQCQM